MAEVEAEPSDNLYVANLPADCTEAMIEEIFGAYKSCRILAKKTPDMGTSVAMVRFGTVAEAKEIRDAYDGGEIEGCEKPLMIRYAGKKAGGQADGYGKASGKSWGKNAASSPYGAGATAKIAEKSDNLYVQGLPAGVDDAWIKHAFGEHGATVVQCKVLPAKNDGPSWHAMVRFQSVEEAERIKEDFDGATVEGQVLEIDYVYKKDAKGEGSKGADKGAGKGGGWGKGSEWGKSSDWGNDWGKSGKSADWGKGNGAAAAKGKAAAKGGKPTGAGGKSMVKGGGKGASMVKGGGKGGTKGMDEILKLVSNGKFLPGAELTNEDNALFVSGLPLDCDDLHLYKLLAPFGAIIQHGVTAMKHPDGTCKGFGFVNFVDAAGLQAAIDTIDGMQLPDGTTISAHEKRSKAR